MQRNANLSFKKMIHEQKYSKKHTAMYVICIELHLRIDIAYHLIGKREKKLRIQMEKGC